MCLIAFHSIRPLVARLVQLGGLSAEFYRNALLYLSYTSLESLSEQERLQMAFDLGISALVGEDIYSFGDLV